MAENSNQQDTERKVQVSLCWSLTARHVHELSLQVPEGSILADVLSLAAELETLNLLKLQTPGIWGRKVPWTHVVQEGDRIEFYRPLQVDPKVARRQRFKRQGKGRTGLFANRKSGSAAGY
jgi:putative ubiquitin-RnfH superfamily antitoxin RatB of RatAB toxin-antitoxin module